MLTKKQIKAIEELTGYIGDKTESKGPGDTFFGHQYNISFYPGEIHVCAGDMNFSKETYKKFGWHHKKKSKGVYLFYPRGLAPLAKILEEE